MGIPKVIQIVGPTASGKTSFSLKLASALDAEIINVDSMQVYTDLQVGTDKPSPSQCGSIPVHGIDLIPLGPPMDASEFGAYARAKITEIHDRGRICILSGGTGLYHRSIIHGLIAAPSRDDEIRAKLRLERDSLGIAAMYARLVQIDPIGASKIYETDWVRIERALEVYALTGRTLSAAQAEHGFKTDYAERLSFGCIRPRDVLYKKIEERLDEMWTGGIFEETQRMLDAGLPLDQLPLKALGYKQAALVLTGQISSDEGLVLAKRETRRFAKRQLTWFRADKSVQWIDLPVSDDAFAQICDQCRAFYQSSDA